jgi:hypothetical protein
MPLRKFLDKLTNEVQSTINQAGNWSGYAPGGGAGGVGYAAPVGFGMTQTPRPCPRRQPQAGYQDWIGLGDARFATFNVCPSCYDAYVRPTPYAGAFITKAGAIAPPPHVAVRCDMSRFWVRVAGMVLLSMNQDGRQDATLLARVAGLRAQDGECPNAEVAAEQQPLSVARRTWYTLQEQTTGMQPLPGWTVCAACVLAIQTCCPAIAGSFAPVQPQGLRDATCGIVPSDHYDDQRTAMILQQIAGCVATAAITRRSDTAQLVGWLRANPPPLRTGIASPSGPGAAAGGTPVYSPAVALSVGGGGPCPRDLLSTTHKCHTMQGLFDLTVCEKCYTEVVKPDAEKGVELARRFDGNASTMPSGFTCQLYSDRMRRAWADAVSTGSFEHLRQKVVSPSHITQSSTNSR